MCRGQTLKPFFQFLALFMEIQEPKQLAVRLLAVLAEGFKKKFDYNDFQVKIG